MVWAFPTLKKGVKVRLLLKDVLDVDNRRDESASSIVVYGIVTGETPDFLLLTDAHCRPIAAGTLRNLSVRKASIIVIYKEEEESRLG